MDLAKSTLKPANEARLAKELAPEAVPPRSVAETSQITTTRHTDLLAIVTTVGGPRATKRGHVLDVTVMDASESAPGVYAKVMVSV